jgi:hypothetical protein
MQLQGTRPQTIAYGLTDSPAGQLAWIVEKFKDWTDPAAELPEDAVDRGHLLTDVSIYWLTGTARSSANAYYERFHDPSMWAPKERSTVPVGVAVFPTDVAIRRFAEKAETVVHWSEFDRGGHFAAMETPTCSSTRSGTSSAASAGLRLPEGDEVEDEYATELLNHLVHQVVQAAARSLDLEREPARAESDRVLAGLVRRVRTERRVDDPIEHGE